MSSRDRDTKSLQDKLKVFFKKGGTAPMSTRNELTIGPELERELSADTPQSRRLRAIKEVGEKALQIRIQEGGVEKIWSCTRDLLEDPNPEARHTVLCLLRRIAEGQEGHLLIMRTILFHYLRDTHATHSPDDTQLRFKLLYTLTNSGKNINCFEEQIGSFLLEWLPQIQQPSQIIEFLQLIINVVKFNATYLDEEIVHGIVNNACYLCVYSADPGVVQCCLSLLEAVVSYSLLPRTALRTFVAALCRTVNIEQYCQNSWKLMRYVVGADIGHAALQEMVDILRAAGEDAEAEAAAGVDAEADAGLLRGAVFYINMALWGPRRVHTLKVSFLAVLPAFLKAISGKQAAPVVIYEVVVALQSLVTRLPHELYEPAWNVLLRIIHVILEHDKSLDPGNELIHSRVHALISSLEALQESGQYRGDPDALLDLLDCCVHDRPVSHITLQYRGDCSIGRTAGPAGLLRARPPGQSHYIAVPRRLQYRTHCWTCWTAACTTARSVTLHSSNAATAVSDALLDLLDSACTTARNAATAVSDALLDLLDCCVHDRPVSHITLQYRGDCVSDALLDLLDCCVHDRPVSHITLQYRGDCSIGRTAGPAGLLRARPPGQSHYIPVTRRLQYRTHCWTCWTAACTTARSVTLHCSTAATAVSDALLDLLDCCVHDRPVSHITLQYRGDCSIGRTAGPAGLLRVRPPGQLHNIAVPRRLQYRTHCWTCWTAACTTARSVTLHCSTAATAVSDALLDLLDCCVHDRPVSHITLQYRGDCSIGRTAGPAGLLRARPPGQLHNIAVTRRLQYRTHCWTCWTAACTTARSVTLHSSTAATAVSDALLDLLDCCVHDRPYRTHCWTCWTAACTTARSVTLHCSTAATAVSDALLDLLDCCVHDRPVSHITLQYRGDCSIGRTAGPAGLLRARPPGQLHNIPVPRRLQYRTHCWTCWTAACTTARSVTLHCSNAATAVSDALLDLLDCCVHDRPKRCVTCACLCAGGVRAAFGVGTRGRPERRGAGGGVGAGAGAALRLAERYLRRDARLPVRLHAFAALLAYVRRNRCAHGEELAERVGGAIASACALDAEATLRAAAARALPELARLCSPDACTDFIDLLEKILNRPFEMYVTDVPIPADADTSDLRLAVSGLLELLHDKLLRSPGTHATRCLLVLIDHLDNHYRRPALFMHHPDIRIKIFDMLFGLRANAFNCVGFCYEGAGGAAGGGGGASRARPVCSPFLLVEPPAVRGQTPQPLQQKDLPPGACVFPAGRAARTLAGALTREADWAVLAHVLRALPALLQARALVVGRRAHDLDLLASTLCAMVSERSPSFPESLRVNSGQKLLLSEFHATVLPALAALASYHNFLEPHTQQRIIRCLLRYGMVLRAPQPYINALTIFTLETRETMVKMLPEVLLDLSKISDTQAIASPMLEFLSTLTRLPRVFASFVEDQYMSVFAILLPYTNPSRYNHYVVSLAHHVIAAWFLKCRLSYRRNFVRFIIHGLHNYIIMPFEEQLQYKSNHFQQTSSANEDSSNRQRSSSLGSKAVSRAPLAGARALSASPAAPAAFHVELTETCIDLLARYTFTPCAVKPQRGTCAVPPPRGARRDLHRPAGALQLHIVRRQAAEIRVPCRLHGELTETCIDLLARYTFTSCVVKPQRYVCRAASTRSSPRPASTCLARYIFTSCAVKPQRYVCRAASTGSSPRPASTCWRATPSHRAPSSRRGTCVMPPPRGAHRDLHRPAGALHLHIVRRQAAEVRVPCHLHGELSETCIDLLARYTFTPCAVKPQRYVCHATSTGSSARPASTCWRATPSHRAPSSRRGTCAVPPPRGAQRDLHRPAGALHLHTARRQAAEVRVPCHLHGELSETCIDLLARYTFTPCAVKPQRSDMAEFLFNGGQSTTWLVGHKLITITTSGCLQNSIKQGLCERCAVLCRQHAESMAPLQQPQVQTNDNSDHSQTNSSSNNQLQVNSHPPEVKRQNSSENKTNDPVVDALNQLTQRFDNISKEVETSVRGEAYGAGAGGSCPCWCGAWAELHVRSPTGDVSWLLRLQNQMSWSQLQEWPLQDVLALLAPPDVAHDVNHLLNAVGDDSVRGCDETAGDLHKSSSDSVVAGEKKAPHAASHCILPHPPHQPPPQRMSTQPINIPGSPQRQSSSSTTDDDDLLLVVPEGKSRHPVRRSNSSPEMSSSWKLTAREQEDEIAVDPDEMILLPRCEPTTAAMTLHANKKAAKKSDMRVSCEAIPEEISGTSPLTQLHPQTHIQTHTQTHTQTHVPTNVQANTQTHSKPNLIANAHTNANVNAHMTSHPHLKTFNSDPGETDTAPTDSQIHLHKTASDSTVSEGRGRKPPAAPRAIGGAAAGAASGAAAGAAAAGAVTAGGAAAAGGAELEREELPPLSRSKRSNTISVMSPTRRHREANCQRSSGGGMAPSFMFLQLYHNMSTYPISPPVPGEAPTMLNPLTERPLKVTGVQHERTIKNLDLVPPLETYKIGVLYVGPGQQDNEVAILKNEYGSVRYSEFLRQLGTLVPLDGGDEPNLFLNLEKGGKDGQYTYVWNDDIMQVQFHVATAMPSSPKDPSCNEKRKYIGNDYVSIVYNDSGADFNIHTIKGQLNFCIVVVEPFEHSMNRVFVKSKEERIGGTFLAHVDAHCVSDHNVALLARQVAVHCALASLISQSLKLGGAPYASNSLERLRLIKRLRRRAEAERLAAAARAPAPYAAAPERQRRVAIDDFNDYT
ncbi:unnamed protein product [Parnassius apollo]|uniref:(apollo) hypothetical protein n=1 Tax=Parnassius apollo TaxID=110799 RepID=A0A8S3XLP4_PARAO|nr:unnamed protein product [Parnassius apollo]